MTFLGPTLNTSKKGFKLELLSAETVPSYFEFLQKEGIVLIDFVVLISIN